ncbi:MAG: hypothetical protein ACI37Q_04875, partial [Candidatus Gastranaerophilaceae bacterium]
MPKLTNQKLRKYNYLANSKKITLKALSVAALAGCAILGAPSAHAVDVVVDTTDGATTITTTLDDGTEKSIELQTTYGEGNSSVTADFTILGQEVPYTYKFDNVYGDTANADTIVTTDVTVLGLPVTFTYNYDSSTALPPQTIVDEDITGNFVGNSADYAGGAIYKYDGTSNIITGSFIGNYSIRENDPLYGHLWPGGGAIYNGGKISSIIGDFIGNYDISLSSFVAEGGAIKIDLGTIGNISGNFVGNYVTSSNNSIYGSRGGAIKNGSLLSTIGNISGSFIGNYATGYNTEGGAISNQAIVNNIKGDFIGNYVEGESSALGGAIGNSYGGYYATPEIGIVDASTFIRNYAKSSEGYAAGGAISNSKSIGEIRNASFIGNYAVGDAANGGAIYNVSQDSNSTATIGNITGDFIGNYAQSTSDYAWGGAIANIGEIDNITGDFIDNYAQGSSASGGAIANIGEIGDITGDFIGNYVTNATDRTIDNYAISSASTTATIANNNGNSAVTYVQEAPKLTAGGAIFNDYGTIGDINGNFSNNYALSEVGDAYGGAIYNESPQTAGYDISYFELQIV